MVFHNFNHFQRVWLPAVVADRGMTYSQYSGRVRYNSLRPLRLSAASAAVRAADRVDRA